MSVVGVAGGRLGSPTSHSVMGATDVLPYPRRRSSIQLEPLDCRIPTAPSSQSSPVVKSRTTSTGTEEDGLPETTVTTPSPPPALNPVRISGHRRLGNSISNETRCNSCENPRRGRSQSLRPVRPGEAPRRRLPSDELYEDQTTAEFIEQLRKDLISQLNYT